MSFLEEFEHLRIPLKDIVKATKNFKTIIGGGGYGSVYKGEIIIPDYPDHKILVAVKRQPKVSLFGQGLKEFLTELELLHRIRHRNLINLLGYCHEDTEKLLVYEYASLSSLDNYLKTASCPITWRQRIKICLDVANGLAYCHGALSKALIHRDIKSANILLDANMNAKIGDFGLSVLGRANEDQAYRNVSGTPGYCDPTYIKSGILTTKSDVYSFGVVIFELLCGRLCFINVTGEQRDLVPLVRRFYDEGKLNEIMDLRLKDLESVKVVSKIAYQCLQDDPEKRPSIGSVAEELHIALLLQEHDEASVSQAGVDRMEFRGGGELLELQGFRVLQPSLIPEALGVHSDQQRIDQLPSEGSMRPVQRTLINQIKRNDYQVSGQTDGSIDDAKLLSYTDFCYRHGISNTKDENIIPEHDVYGQPPSVGVMANARFSNPSNMGDPYYGDSGSKLNGDRESGLNGVSRQQPSQAGGCLEFLRVNLFRKKFRK